MKLRSILFAVITICSFTVMSSANSATLLTLNGELIGAEDVNVVNSLYNVSFIDGTCATAYGECKSNLPFNNKETAILAAESLINQVFIGIYDTNPSLTRGCEITSWGSNFCRAMIPYYDYNTQFIGADNYDIIYDNFSINSFPEWFDFTLFDSYVYAVFTPTTKEEVPTPTSWELMLIGIVAAYINMRQRRAVTASMHFSPT